MYEEGGTERIDNLRFGPKTSINRHWNTAIFIGSPWKGWHSFGWAIANPGRQLNKFLPISTNSARLLILTDRIINNFYTNISWHFFVPASLRTSRDRHFFPREQPFFTNQLYTYMCIKFSRPYICVLYVRKIINSRLVFARVKYGFVIE